MTRDEWLELATRCEKATGPDARIDGTIAKAVNLLSADAHFLGQDAWGLETNIWVIGGFASYEFPDVEEYTASLDAITALIERELLGWYCTSTHIPPEFRSDETLPFDASLVGNIREEQFGYDEPPELTHAVHPGAGATEPLARCAAFCRTMAERAAP
jgi:hypothetical protein